MKKLAIVLLIFLTFKIWAEEEYHFNLPVVSCKDKTGYLKGEGPTDKNDPHFGWTLGEFIVTGHTRIINDDGTYLLLKTPGNNITLFYRLVQDINALNGDKSLSINEDKNGYDGFFEIKQTNFGRGCLIISHTDYAGVKKDPIIYTNFLSAKCSRQANTSVQLLEEGDYLIKLNYEIKKDSMNIPFTNKNLRHSWKNYYVYARIKVVNGDCMVFPRDVGTQSELGNYAVTSNGFFLDLAKSHYLEISVTKEILQDENLITDTRMNRAVNEGTIYTDEGIYTIYAYNPYTKASTTKKIYVGNNPILIKHARYEGRLTLAEIIHEQDNHAKLYSDTHSQKETPTGKKSFFYNLGVKNSSSVEKVKLFFINLFNSKKQGSTK